jgi:hypothetical protein
MEVEQPHTILTKSLPPLTSNIILAILLIVLAFLILCVVTQPKEMQPMELDTSQTTHAEQNRGWEHFNYQVGEMFRFAYPSYVSEGMEIGHSPSTYDSTNVVLTYKNTAYGFSFEYPADSILTSSILEGGETLVLPEEDHVCVFNGINPSLFWRGLTPEFLCIHVQIEEESFEAGLQKFFEDEAEKERNLGYKSMYLEYLPKEIIIPGADRAAVFPGGLRIKKGRVLLTVYGSFLANYGDFFYEYEPFNDNIFSTLRLD